MYHRLYTQLLHNLPLIMTSLAVLTVFAMAMIINQNAQLKFLRAEENSCNAYFAKPGPQPYVEEVDPNPGYMFFQNYVWEIRNDTPCADGANRQGTLADGTLGGQTECSQKLGVPLAQAWCYGFGTNNERPYCLKYVKPVSSCSEVKPISPTPVPDNPDDPPAKPDPVPTTEPRKCSDGPDLEGTWSTNCQTKCISSGSIGQGIAFDKTSLSPGNCDTSKTSDTYCYPFTDGNYCTSKTSSSGGSGGGGSSGGVSNAANITKQFVAAIKAACGSSVNSSTRSCIPNINVPGGAKYKDIIIRDFRASIDNFVNLQCVYFAKDAFMLYTGCQPYTSSFSCEDDRSVAGANQYVNNRYVNADVLAPSAQPKEGDLIVFHSVHIAVVVEVLNNSVTICEGNLTPGSADCGRSIPRGSGDIAGYLRYKGAK